MPWVLAHPAVQQRITCSLWIQVPFLVSFVFEKSRHLTLDLLQRVEFDCSSKLLLCLCSTRKRLKLGIFVFVGNYLLTLLNIHVLACP